MSSVQMTSSMFNSCFDVGTQGAPRIDAGCTHPIRQEKTGGLAWERAGCQAQDTPSGMVITKGWGRINMLKGIGALAATLILGGCATVTRGTTDQVQIRSAPNGAIATASTEQRCTTPCTIAVGRKDEFSVHFEKPGFISQDIQVKTQVFGAGEAGLAGNLVVGGIVGMATDASTGATLDHVPNPVNVELRPARASAKFRPAHLPSTTLEEAGKTS